MRIEWDKTGERTYENGVDHCVLYPQVEGAYPKGVPWNGITGITESPSGAEPTKLWADNINYLTLVSAEELGLTVECYTYPVEWNACNGIGKIADGVVVGQQKRQNFGLSYRTNKGNDVEHDEFGYKLHLVYGCTASVSERGYSTTNDSPDAIVFSYSVSTVPVTAADGLKPTSIITIDSTVVNADKLKELEDILYGTNGSGSGDGNEPRLPMPAEVVQMFAAG